MDLDILWASMTNHPQDVEQQLQHVGERLALLLASANLPDEMKDAWAALIPEMSLEQLDRLANLLSQSLGDAADTEFQAFVAALKQAKEEQNMLAKKAEEKAMNDLDEIEAVLKDS